MASSMLAARKALPSFLLQKVIHPARFAAASSAARSFNTNAQMRDLEDRDPSTELDRGSARSPVSRRSSRSPASMFPDALDPIFASTSLSQMMNMMDQMMESPFPALARGLGGGSRRGWDVREDNDALYLRVDMPGLGKENVSVSAEENTLIIKGEGEADTGDGEGRRYSSRIDFPPHLYQINQIKAEMKNGVLKVVVPKVKEEERKDVFHVKIE